MSILLGILKYGSYLTTFVVLTSLCYLTYLLNVDTFLLRVSKCPCLTVVRLCTIFLTLRKILRFVCAITKKMHLNHFYRFFCMLYTSYVNFWEIYLNFCAQNSKLYFFTVQENQHLECMFLLSKTIVCLLLYNTIVILTHFHCLSALLFCHTV